MTHNTHDIVLDIIKPITSFLKNLEGYSTSGGILKIDRNFYYHLQFSPQKSEIPEFDEFIQNELSYDNRKQIF